MDIDSSPVVLVALDLSPVSDDALVAARTIVKARDGKLHLLHVVAADVEAPLVDEQLEQWRARVRAAALDGIEHELHAERAASPAAAIVAKAAAINADLIVVGTAGRRGLRRFVLGSCAEEVARTAGCAVLIARAKSHAS